MGRGGEEGPGRRSRVALCVERGGAVLLRGVAVREEVWPVQKRRGAGARGRKPWPGESWQPGCHECPGAATHPLTKSQGFPNGNASRTRSIAQSSAPFPNRASGQSPSQRDSVLVVTQSPECHFRPGDYR